MLKQFQRFGSDLFYRGLTSSHGGNMSVRMGDRIFITRTGSMLAHLEENDVIEIGLEEDNSNIMLASSELVVHRADLSKHICPGNCACASALCSSPLDGGERCDHPH